MALADDNPPYITVTRFGSGGTLKPGRVWAAVHQVYNPVHECWEIRTTSRTVTSQREATAIGRAWAKREGLAFRPW